MPEAKASGTGVNKETLAEDSKKSVGAGKNKGLKIEPLFTRKFAGKVLESIEYEKRSCKIINPDGSVVFEMEAIEVPAAWSKTASDILISKYLRKKGVPQLDKFGNPLKNPDGSPELGSETSVKQVINRLAGCWRSWGEKYGYFSSSTDAKNYEDEMKYMLVHQVASPNSPQWFNTGLAHTYKIAGPAQGHWYADPETGHLKQSEDAYTHPQPHACQPYNALVNTPLGALPIGKIVTKKMIGLEVYDSKGTTKITAVKRSGKKDVYRVVLKNNNYVEATADHIVMVSKQRGTKPEWAQIQELKPGMHLRQRCNTSIPKNDINDSEVAESALAGWIQGDGFVGQYQSGRNRSLTMELMTINENEHLWVESHLNKLFSHIHRHERAANSQDPALDIRRIRLYGEKLRQYIEKYDLERTGIEMQVPEKIMLSGQQQITSYLKSLFQADGCVRIRERSGSRSADIVLTTIAPQLAKDVLTLLGNMGIYARINKCRDSRENRLPTYQVIIAYESARKKFMELIGFISRKKIEALQESFARVNGKKTRNTREEKIVRIEHLGEMAVFDIETESHNYLSNNIIVHNCFIQSIKDDLVNKGGIFDLIVREARIFKYGSGTGTNFSALRAVNEPLSGGGKSSGLMSWLQIFDRAAGSIKSGGTTRRASKMVILNADHPDIEIFIDWKYREEKKAADLIAAGYSGGIDGEAYLTISGQNSNNSIRVTDEFMEAVKQDADWHLRARTNYDHITKTIKAKHLWEKIAKAAWHCGDPGVQFDSTVNAWHTCLSSGRINASNPCSEFMFLDDSSCNLGSLNLAKFYDHKSGKFDIGAFRHAVRLWTVTLEISVLMAQFPSYEIAKNSYLYRPLGLGYANLGSLLMLMGHPYDSAAGRAVAATITALMTGESYTASAELAHHLSPFKTYEKNKNDMLRVIRNHRRAAYSMPESDYEGLKVTPPLLIEADCPAELLQAAREAWDRALLEGGQYGFRNAQTTLLAPTGTIGLAMDCDTTGIEPDYALVKFKKLSGGGYFKIINQSVPKALEHLKYTQRQINEIIEYIIGSGTLEGAPHLNRESLKRKGLTEEELNQVEERLLGAFELNQPISGVLAESGALERLGLQNDASNIFSNLGFSGEQITEANDYICGRMTIEGAPQLKEEHLPIFDCANRCGQHGRRFILPSGHIEMMAAVQPFLSGAISKTVNLPEEATEEEIEKILLDSWKRGLKAVAIYRDGSKVAQPLQAKESVKAKEGAVQKEIVIEYRPVRRRLPKEHMSITRKVKVGGHKMYLTLGLYNDKKPGELFIIMNQQGSFAAGMADSFAKMVSVGLQYGVPVETIVSQLRHMRFQPMGFTGDSDITSASSISDFIAQMLENKFLKGGEAVKLPFEERQLEKPAAPVKESKTTSAQIPLVNKPAESLNARLGFSGEMCPECGLATMVANGKCYKCLNCGATTGCS